MKNYSILILFATLLFAGCNGSAPNYALLSGEITHPNGANLNIINDSGKVVRKIAVGENGLFADTIFNADGYYTLHDGKEMTTLFLKGGYALDLKLDAAEFDETLVYAGKGAEANNYLAQKFLSNETELGDLKSLFGLDEAAFLEKSNAAYTSLVEKLKGLPKAFTKAEEKNLQYENALRLMQYKSYHPFISGDKDFKVSENFPNPMADIPTNDEAAFAHNPSYKSLVSMYFEELSDSIAMADNISPTRATAKSLQMMPEGIIRESMVKDISYRLAAGNDDNETLYEVIMKESSDEELKAKLTERMEKLRLLTKGNDSPVFENYENYKGGTTSLADLKGKYVYIDVWATWCGPCKSELPHLKALSEKYAGKKIAFVSISVDTPDQKETWKKMIKEDEMNWIQLFSDRDWKSDFVTAYGINGIPHFIFLDPQGKIISASAPRPSMKEAVETLFKEYGI